jgi:F-type H+-transporting ATPase subunit delta
MAESNTIARPYAEAVFELAREAGTLEEWSNALGLASELMADGQVAGFLANPSLSDGERLEFVTGLLSSAVRRGEAAGR